MRMLVTTDLDDPHAILRLDKVGEQKQSGEVYFKMSNGEYYHQAYCWPIAWEQEVITLITERARLKKAYDDSMKLVYELKNKIKRNDPH